MLSNIINAWKNHTNRMNKFISLFEAKDYKCRLIFRDYRSTGHFIESKKILFYAMRCFSTAYKRFSWKFQLLLVYLDTDRKSVRLPIHIERSVLSSH